MAGRFCWYDLMSSDPARAQEFYTQLVGWTVQEVDMGEMGPYPMFHVGEAGVGGLMKLESTEIPSHWISYVSVDDLDASAAKVVELGGHVYVPITPIPGIGRFSVIGDRQGAVISLFQPNPGGSGQMGQAPGHFVWNELQTPDPVDARAFYSALLGWAFTEMDMGGGNVYYLVKRDDNAGPGGIMKAQGEFPALWLPYIAVAEINAAADRAKALGANVLVPPMEIPGTGFFTVVQDPTGAAVALYQHTSAS